MHYDKLWTYTLYQWNLKWSPRELNKCQIEEEMCGHAWVGLYDLYLKLITPLNSGVWFRTWNTSYCHKPTDLSLEWKYLSQGRALLASYPSAVKKCAATCVSSTSGVAARCWTLDVGLPYPTPQALRPDLRSGRPPQYLYARQKLGWGHDRGQGKYYMVTLAPLAPVELRHCRRICHFYWLVFTK